MREQAQQQRKAPAQGTLHDLRVAPLRALPLTPLQARRVDAALEAGRDPGALLSPRQHRLRTRIVRALELDEKALQGMRRPKHIDELPLYLAALERALTQLELKPVRKPER